MTYFQQNENNSTTTTSSETSTTTSRTRAPACSEYDLSVLADEYTEVLNFPPTLAVMHFIHECLSDGMEPAAVSHAINETAWARSPSPHYLHAILSRYRRDGLMTMEAVMIDERRRREWQESSRRRMQTDIYGY